jgi:hypothetical protein
LFPHGNEPFILLCFALLPIFDIDENSTRCPSLLQRVGDAGPIAEVASGCLDAFDDQRLGEVEFLPIDVAVKESDITRLDAITE